MTDAGHREEHSGATAISVTQLSCGLVDVLERVEVLPGLRTFQIHSRGEAVERFY